MKRDVVDEVWLLDERFWIWNYDDIDWNITTQDFILSGGGNLTDFPDVKNSESYKEAHTFNSNKDYNWSSNDSRDSGGTDWDSDW